MSGRMEFEFQFRQPAAHAARRDERDGRPMRIAVLGDFSGRENRGLEDPQGIARRPVVSYTYVPRVHRGRKAPVPFGEV